jgi:hypothetical protein
MGKRDKARESFGVTRTTEQDDHEATVSLPPGRENGVHDVNRTFASSECSPMQLWW